MTKYAIELVWSEEDGGYIATVPELPGCSAFGETEEEALREVKVAQELWLKAARKEGRPVPKPVAQRRYSGRFALRMPPELHRRLDLEAKKQRVSMNQLLVSTLSDRASTRGICFRDEAPVKGGSRGRDGHLAREGKRPAGRKGKKEAA
jgi:predicted RNase H-like HicB family nuclease